MMANFTDFEVGVESPTNDPDDEVSEYPGSLESFIDDGDEDDILLSRSFYHKFEKVNVSVDETLEEQYKKSAVGIEDHECSNFCETSGEEGEIDEFKDVEKRVEKFEETLLPLQMKMRMSIHLLMLYYLQKGLILKGKQILVAQVI